MTTSTAEGQRRGSIEIGEEKLLVLKAGKDAGFVEFAYLAPKHLKTQFEAICKDTIDNQTEHVTTPSTSLFANSRTTDGVHRPL